MNMAMQQYCLRWNNHQPNFISVFSNLLNSESLVDVTLSADGRHLQAHKLVLSACSSYFQSLFTMNPCQHPIVILKDVKFTDLKVIIDFMYYGEVNVSQDELPHILKTAEALKIKGLAEIPVEASLKQQNNTTERTELLTPAETNWNPENQRQSSSSPCPLSPASKRKRLRKTSTGSGSTEKHISEEHSSNEVTLSSPTTMAVIKPDPGFCGGDNSHKGSPKACQTPAGSDNTETSSPHTINLHVPHEMPAQHSVENTTIDMAGPSATTQTVTGYQWGIVDQHYPHFTQATLTLPQEMQYTAAPPPPPPTYVTTAACIPNVKPEPTEPTQTPPKRKRSVNPQSQDNFVQALDAVRFGGIGFCKAARMFGVNNRTLWIEYKKRGYPVNRLSIKNRKSENSSTQPSEAEAQSPAQSQCETADEVAQHGHMQQQQQQSQQHQQHQQQQQQQHQQQQQPQHQQPHSPPATIHHPIPSNPVTMFSGAFIDGRPVEIATPVLHRSRYFDNGLIHTTPINLNFDQM